MKLSLTQLADAMEKDNITSQNRCRQLRTLEKYIKTKKIKNINRRRFIQKVIQICGDDVLYVRDYLRSLSIKREAAQSLIEFGRGEDIR